MLTFSEEPFLAGAAFESGVMVFACLVLVLAPSWIVVEIENEKLRNVVEPLRAFVFVSVVLWLCLRGLMLLPGGVWGEGGVEEAVGVLETVIFPCNAAHERTDDSESFLCGWRRPSALCLGSLASLVMALAGSRRRNRKKRRFYKRTNHQKTVSRIHYI